MADGGTTVVAAAPAPDEARFRALDRPPIIAADQPETLALARLTAQRIRWDEVYGTASDRVSVEALPFLYRTEAGRTFLAGAGQPWALARGMPAQICPAATATVAAPGTSRPALAEQALTACLAALKDQHPDCGCRVLALDDYLTVPREDLSYATGTTARLRAPALGADAVLVAEENGRGAIVLRDLVRTVGVVSRSGDGVDVTLLPDGPVFRGRSVPEGYRRGRIAERIYATDAQGRRLSLLIGFSPEELRQRAAAFLAWPAGG